MGVEVSMCVSVFSPSSFPSDVLQLYLHGVCSLCVFEDVTDVLQDQNCQNCQSQKNMLGGFMAFT